MRDSFSPGCERAIKSARLYAGADGSTVDSSHLVLGLFHDNEAVAFALASQCGGDVFRWNRRQSAKQGVEPVEIMTLQAERALRQARSWAREFLVDRTVTSELLLLAVLETDSVVAGELADIGLDSKKLRQLVLDPLTTLIPLVDSTSVARASEPTKKTCSGNDLDRILDAAGNRAREALRVLEDYVRFGRDDASITGELKTLRHALTKVMSELPKPNLLSARNTLEDVGTEISTEGEYQRSSIADVVSANLRRLQEALRSLEEFGKVYNPNLGRQFERLRYQSYTLEKRLSPSNDLKTTLNDARLYLLMPITSLQRPWEELLRSAIDGGVQVVQLRDKSLEDRELLGAAERMREITRQTDTLFIVNDRVDIALACGADGVHLGQDDMPIATVRKIAGQKILVGVSTHNSKQLTEAIHSGADYVGVGPTFPSSTKTFEQLAGLDFVTMSRSASALAFVLGGINLDNLDAVIVAGGRRVAVSGAILNCGEPANVAREMRRRLDHAGVAP